MFQENKFKVEIIQALPSDARITLYRVGPMVDLCRGPHVPHTGILKAVAVTNASRAFWRADVKSDPLQRVYAITFPDSKLLKEYKHRIEEAKKRDHRTVGPAQELFFFHPLSPGRRAQRSRPRVRSTPHDPPSQATPVKPRCSGVSAVQSRCGLSARTT